MGWSSPSWCLSCASSAAVVFASCNCSVVASPGSSRTNTKTTMLTPISVGTNNTIRRRTYVLISANSWRAIGMFPRLPPDLLLFIYPDFGSQLGAEPVIGPGEEVADVGLQAGGPDVGGMRRVVHLVPEIALDIEQLFLAFGFIERPHLLFDHPGQFGIVDAGVIPGSIRVIHVEEEVVGFGERRLETEDQSVAAFKIALEVRGNVGGVLLHLDVGVDARRLQALL